MNISSLPKNTLCLIFSFLPIHIVSITCKKVCKKWESLISTKIGHKFESATKNKKFQFIQLEKNKNLVLTRTNTESILWDMNKRECEGILLGDFNWELLHLENKKFLIWNKKKSSLFKYDMSCCNMNSKIAINIKVENYRSFQQIDVLDQKGEIILFSIFDKKATKMVKKKKKIINFL